MRRIVAHALFRGGGADADEVARALPADGGVQCPELWSMVRDASHDSTISVRKRSDARWCGHLPFTAHDRGDQSISLAARAATVSDRKCFTHPLGEEALKLSSSSLNWRAGALPVATISALAAAVGPTLG
jgi:hypothetical protein